MNDYVEVRFDVKPCDEVATDVLAAMLCEGGYESFVPDAEGLTAYVKRELFEESLEYFKDSNLEIKYITYDLHNSGFEGNVTTEHEEMFTAQGIKTKFLIAIYN